MFMIDRGYRKYGEDGAALVKTYCVAHCDNQNAQFVRYLAERSKYERKNLFKVHPGTFKKDGGEVSQVEADQMNTSIPSDYFSMAYFNRQTKSQMMTYFIGCTFGGLLVCAGGLINQRMYNQI